MLETVSVRDNPVDPQLTRPFGSAGSLPNASDAADSETCPCVPAPVSGRGAGKAEHKASEVRIAIVAGYAAGAGGTHVTIAGGETPPPDARANGDSGATRYPARIVSGPPPSPPLP